ncbi:MAG: hypothetical protein AAGC55_06635 [Myxococcota bacterium]
MQLFRVLCLFFLGLLAIAPLGGPAGADSAAGELVGVHIASHPTGSDAAADDTPERVTAEVGVTLYAVLEARQGRQRILYSDAPVVKIRGRVWRTRPMKAAPAAALRWYKVEPAVDTMSNEASGSFRFESIEYREVAVSRWADQSQLAAEVRPTLTPYRGDEYDRRSDPESGIGTMRYKLVARAGATTVATAGIEARRGRGSGGLSDRVHRVSLRRDNSFLGYMTEMYGQPYIWASGGVSPGKHQSERLEGSDCADLMVYGMRRMGRKIPYVWTGELGKYARRLSKGTVRDDGVYVDAKGAPIRFPRVGDLVLFPRHVGALVADRGVRGVLDQADIMMHTLFASPREQAIGATAYGEMPIEVLRWK